MFSNSRNIVFVHDLIPTSWEVEHVPRLNGVWAGDVWKVAFEIMQTKGLDFKIISIDYGVGIIKVKDNKAKLMDLRNEKPVQNMRLSIFELRYRKSIMGS